MSGSKGPAEHGQLTIFASGPEDARPRLAPLFDALGQRTIWVGRSAPERDSSWLPTPGSLAAEAVNTSVALGPSLGLETQTLMNAFDGSPLVSPWQAAKLQRIAEGDFSAQFALSLALKDVHLALEAAGDDRFRDACRPGRRMARSRDGLAGQVWVLGRQRPDGRYPRHSSQGGPRAGTVPATTADQSDRYGP